MTNYASVLESYMIDDIAMEAGGILQGVVQLIIRVFKALSSKIGIVIGAVVGLIMAMKGGKGGGSSVSATKPSARQVSQELTNALAKYTSAISEINGLAIKGIEKFQSEDITLILKALKQVPVQSKKDLRASGIDDNSTPSLALFGLGEVGNLDGYKSKANNFFITLNDIKQNFIKAKANNPGKIASTQGNVIAKANTCKSNLEKVRKLIDKTIKELFGQINRIGANLPNNYKKYISKMQSDCGEISKIIGKVIAEVVEYIKQVKPVI